MFEVWTCVSGNCLIPANTTEIAKVNPRNASQVVLFAMCPRRIAQFVERVQFFFGNTLQYMFATFIKAQLRENTHSIYC